MNLLKRHEGTWNPFHEMDELTSQLNHLFHGVEPYRTRTQGGNGEDSKASQWVPAVDITEDDKEYLIKAELPDVKKEDLSVKVDNGMVTVSGERKLEKEEKNKKFHRIERSYGRFSRSFHMPEDGDEGKVDAVFKDGILEVHLGKVPQAAPKTVEVKVS